MSLFGQTKRHVPSSKPRRSPLPSFANEPEKYALSTSGQHSNWFTVVLVPIPRLPYAKKDGSHANGSAPFSPSKSYFAHGGKVQRRYIRLPLPIPPRLYARVLRLGAASKIALLLLAAIAIGILLLGFRRSPRGRSTWSPPFVDPDTRVISHEEAAMIWEWEVYSGHYASAHEIPEHVPISAPIHNPAVPASLLRVASSPGPLVAYQQRTPSTARASFIGTGSSRRYLTSWETSLAQTGYPPRPTPGGTLDLDLILERCDFGTGKYVRDCLELLRIGGNLDNGRRVRRGNYLGLYKQIFMEETSNAPAQVEPTRNWGVQSPKDRPRELSRTPFTLSPPEPMSPAHAHGTCDPNHPRIFHMFWAGPFSDKPYMAVMSFLFTQNVGLDGRSENESVPPGCRPQFWVWINPGPAAAVPNPSAQRDMYQQLTTNPWSAPFLHERLREVVKFKMWNTTEQLDGVDELRPFWRDMPIFNSGGNTYKQPLNNPTPTEPSTSAQPEESAESTSEPAQTRKGKNGLFEKVGSTSESDYDRLSVILSDMARFVLTHRFGGIYLDADTIFLRDWEELWNYRGQFAYRWSWHQKYNTAVLKLHKGSALSTFLFKTALENGLDFHPMTVSRYLKDAGLDRLLFRIPDALFDPAWLNMERYQRERPPFPYFPEFSVFFSNDKFDTAGAHPSGFDGFFRGAYSYHFHNFWWLPFDPSRDWPDLGPRFIKGENAIKSLMKTPSSPSNISDDDVTSREDMDDEVDLSWSTVLKRTFEAYIRGERPNMYGEWLEW